MFQATWRYISIVYKFLGYTLYWLPFHAGKAQDGRLALDVGPHLHCLAGGWGEKPGTYQPGGWLRRCSQQPCSCYCYWLTRPELKVGMTEAEDLYAKVSSETAELSPLWAVRGEIYGTWSRVSRLSTLPCIYPSAPCCLGASLSPPLPLLLFDINCCMELKRD